ncbi:hypothetical protein [Wohlfahrtiimonas larvae]|uniref:Uncharacterized protein n=1 Tax=Wohlfahrtiimonas larvae TaxID=1157986 RepID=A0ABP9MRZ4_9GAMM|nr:hypothetical protein [Wohlfahrtiimonas larvae]
MNEDHQKSEDNQSPKNQWLWLVGLCIGGGLSMYVLAKLTKMLGIWAGLAPG